MVSPKKKIWSNGEERERKREEVKANKKLKNKRLGGMSSLWERKKIKDNKHGERGERGLRENDEVSSFVSKILM